MQQRFEATMSQIKIDNRNATMPMKKWFRSLQPLQLYIILFLTVLFFLTELVCSHVTHSLTLLMDAYHVLCNIMSLTGCIITIKYGKESDRGSKELSTTDLTKDSATNSITSGCQDNKKPSSANSDKKTQEDALASLTQKTQERKLKNTFGWARIDVISMLICCIFMASLSFSVLVEALQTLVHIDHTDEMHHPVPILIIGVAGLLLNGVCYLLIGGYTFHQGSFLYLTESGDVVLNRVVIQDVVRQGGRRLSRTRTIPLPSSRQRQGCWEMSRDALGLVLVIVCALIVYFTDKKVAKYIDPALSLVSATLLMGLSYPYMKESCLILLQTMPASINIDVLKQDLLKHFPDIVNVHDFHVWQLTATKLISTVHIIFQNQKGYGKVMEDIKSYLVECGITQVTIQPEFFVQQQQETIEEEKKVKETPLCLMQCQGEGCKLSHCCPIYQTDLKKSDVLHKNVAMSSSSPDLRSVRPIDEELSFKTTECSTSKSEDANLNEKTQS